MCTALTTTSVIISAQMVHQRCILGQLPLSDRQRNNRPQRVDLDWTGAPAPRRRCARARRVGAERVGAKGWRSEGWGVRRVGARTQKNRGPRGAGPEGWSARRVGVPKFCVFPYSAANFVLSSCARNRSTFPPTDRNSLASWQTSLPPFSRPTLQTSLFNFWTSLIRGMQGVTTTFTSSTTVPDPKARVKRTSAAGSLATWPIPRTPQVMSPRSSTRLLLQKETRRPSTIRTTITSLTSQKSHARTLDCSVFPQCWKPLFRTFLMVKAKTACIGKPLPDREREKKRRFCDQLLQSKKSQRKSIRSHSLQTRSPRKPGTESSTSHSW